LIAAFALREGATLVHKDPEYDALANEVDMERLPYKVRQER
jgi:predicted nucleic acid-binding protein